MTFDTPPYSARQYFTFYPISVDGIHTTVMDPACKMLKISVWKWYRKVWYMRSPETSVQTQRREHNVSIICPQFWTEFALRQSLDLNIFHSTYNITATIGRIFMPCSYEIIKSILNTRLTLLSSAVLKFRHTYKIELVFQRSPIQATS